jgi:hypothetical protein
MEFAVRRESVRARVAPISQRCPQCHELALMLQRRHISPARLGEPLVTEFYDCDCCDASYKYSPAENRWRAIA